MRYSFLLLLLASTAAAQDDELPDFGVKPLSSTSLPGTPATSESWFRWTAGFTGEVHLFWHLSFEGDALIRKFSLGHLKQTDWDFPMLAKYRFHVKRFRPFVESGLSLSYESQEGYGGGGAHYITYRYNTGPVAGAGLL